MTVRSTQFLYIAKVEYWRRATDFRSGHWQRVELRQWDKFLRGKVTYGPNGFKIPIRVTYRRKP